MLGLGLVSIGLVTNIALLSTPSHAGEVLKSYVEDEGDHYLVYLDMALAADAKKVYARLTNFNALHLINNNVIKSTLIKSTNKTHRVRVEMQGCVLFFCKELLQVQDVTELEGGYIMINVDPGPSNFEFGHILWHIRGDKQRTRVTFSADIVPDFWIPPLIGPWILKRILLAEGKQTIQNLETLAQR